MFNTRGSDAGRKRLEYSVEIFDRIDAQRQSKNDPAIFAAIETRLVREKWTNWTEVASEFGSAPHTV
jgi:hypothetical protein